MYLNNLQSYIFGSALLLMVCFVACEKTDLENKTINFGETLTVQKDDRITLSKNTDSEIEILVTDILDSRCPKDMACIDTGNAIVKLKVSGSNGQTINFELFYWGDQKSFDFSINQKNYHAVLLNVTPYPTFSPNETNNEVKKAEIVITKK